MKNEFFPGDKCFIVRDHEIFEGVICEVVLQKYYIKYVVSISLRDINIPLSFSSEHVFGDVELLLKNLKENIVKFKKNE